jgi:pimeloyl-ACP methyl ester carboxylesterase
VTEAELKANTVPVCGIVGEFDGLRPGAERMLGVMPHYETVIVKGGDHMSTPGNPAFRQALQDFFWKHREGSTVDKTQ